MSHIVTIETEVRDAVCVRAACRRLRLPEPLSGTHKLFNSQSATGEAVQLPSWRYPIVCNVDTGKVAYDNYNGNWGAQAELDRFVQAYAVEKSKLEARRAGYSVSESTQANGSIRLVVTVGS